MEYEYLDHTADAKFRAYGNTLEKAFVNAGYATFAILIDPKKVSQKLQKDISVKSKKLTSLLYDYLEELLFYLDVDGFLLGKIQNLKITKVEEGYKLECEAIGDYFKSYEVKGNVKSVTYNDMVINHSEEGYCLQVVLDL